MKKLECEEICDARTGQLGMARYDWMISVLRVDDLVGVAGRSTSRWGAEAPALGHFVRRPDILDPQLTTTILSIHVISSKLCFLVVASIRDGHITARFAPLLFAWSYYLRSW